MKYFNNYFYLLLLFSLMITNNVSGQIKNENTKEYIKTHYDNFFSPINNKDSINIVLKNGKWGAIGIKKNEIISTKFDFLNFTSTPYLIAVSDSKYGLYNTSGKEIIPISYEYLNPSKENIILAVKENKYGVINQNNQIIIPFEHDLIMHDDQGFILVNYKDNSIQYLDNALNKITTRYRFINDLKNNYKILTKKDGNNEEESAVQNPDGKIILDFILGKFVSSSKNNNLLKYYNKNQMGVYSVLQKKWIIPAGSYEDIDIGENSVVTVVSTDDGPYKFYDMNGNLMNDTDYEEAYPFESNIAIVKKNNKYFLIDKNFKKIGPESIEFESSNQVSILSNGNTIAYVNGKGYGMIDSKGKIIIPFEFQEFDLQGNEYVTLRHNVNKEEGIIDQQGNWIVKLGTYSKIDNVTYKKVDKYWSRFPFVTVSKINDEESAALLDMRTLNLVLPFSKGARYTTYYDENVAVNYYDNEKRNWKNYSELYLNYNFSKKYIFNGYHIFYMKKNKMVYVKTADEKASFFTLDGKELTPQYDELNTTPNKYDGFSFIENGKVGFLDSTLKPKISKFDKPNMIGDVNEIFYGDYTTHVMENGKAVIIDKDFNVVGRSTDFKNYTVTENSLRLTNINPKLSIIMIKDSSKSDIVYWRVNNKIYDIEIDKNDYLPILYINGLVKVKRNNKYGFLDLYGNEIIECKYDWVMLLDNGIVIVKSKGETKKINFQGKQLSFSTGFDFMNKYTK